MLDDGACLTAFRRLDRAQDGDDRRAARHVIDVHRHEAALVMVRVPEGELLATRERRRTFVDVEDFSLAGLHAAGEPIDEGRRQPYLLRLVRRILHREMVDCEASGAPVSGQRRSSFMSGSFLSRLNSLPSS